METADGEGVDGLGKWQGSKYLTDRERDEIDLRGKIILRRSRERVRALENGEKGVCISKSRLRMGSRWCGVVLRRVEVRSCFI